MKPKTWSASPVFLRNAGGLCFVQLSAGDGTKIQGMISKKEIGADSLKQFKQLVDLGDHLFIKGRVIASKTGELSVFATEWAIAAKALQPLPALHKERRHSYPQAVHRHDRRREDAQYGA
jgi:lysyl-tRNA synthetase class 2